MLNYIEVEDHVKEFFTPEPRELKEITDFIYNLLKEGNDEHDEEIHTLESAIEDLENDFMISDSKVDLLEDKVEELQRDKDDLENDVISLQNDINYLNTIIAELENKEDIK